LRRCEFTAAEDCAPGDLELFEFALDADCVTAAAAAGFCEVEFAPLRGVAAAPCAAPAFC
jgi:hypothetical protein